MSNPDTVNSREKLWPRIAPADVFWGLVLCSAYLSFFWFWPMYRVYDPIPFTWSALEWRKAAILVPWLAIAVVYVRYRLFSAIAAHVCVAVLLPIAWACIFTFGGNPPEDMLDFAYSVINFNSQWLLFISLFSLPLAVIKVAARRTGHSRPAGGIETMVSGEEQHPTRSGFTVEELLTVIAIIGQLLILFVPAINPGRVLPGHVERYTESLIARRGVDANDADRPEESLIARDIPIEGRWQCPTPWRQCWLDIVPGPNEGSFCVGAGMSTGLGPAIEKRTGTFREGELVLNRPALDFLSHRIYTKLYVVRWHGRDMLIASVNVDSFNKCREGKMPEFGTEGWQKFVMFRESESQ